MAKTETNRVRFEAPLASREVCPGPVNVFSAVLTADAVGVAVLTLRNGSQSGDLTALVLKTALSTSFQANFDPPLFLNRGLYVEFGANIAAVCLVLKERPE